MTIDFFERAIHSILQVRRLYPDSLFEKRSVYSTVARAPTIKIWQCRHPDVNSYIRRVLNNVQPLLEACLIEKMVFVIKDRNDNDVDHVAIKCDIYNGVGSSDSSIQSFEDAAWLLEQEFTQVLIALSFLDAKKLPYAHPDYTWLVMFCMKPSSSSSSSSSSSPMLSRALHSGEWLVG